MKVLSGVLLLGLTLSPHLSQAQDQESCGDILRYASRDISKGVTYSDQRKYFYNKVCRNNDSGINLSYKDVTTALGLSYSSKEEYCSGEKSYDTNINYSQAESSIVVRNSLDAYVACRSLSDKGVLTSLTMPAGEAPIVFALNAQRRSAQPQSVDSLALNPDAVACTSIRDGQSQVLDKQYNTIGFQLPESSAQWSLLCTRKYISDPQGNRTFLPVQMVLTTSAGSFPVSLPQAGYAAGAWTNELRAENISISKKLASVESTFASQKIIAQCSGDGWLPRPAAPACPSGFKDSGQFSHSAPGGPHGFGGNCRICLGN